jgi:hypothetical protein
MTPLSLIASRQWKFTRLGRYFIPKKLYKPTQLFRLLEHRGGHLPVNGTSRTLGNGVIAKDGILDVWLIGFVQNEEFCQHEVQCTSPGCEVGISIHVTLLGYLALFEHSTCDFKSYRILGVHTASGNGSMVLFEIRIVGDECGGTVQVCGAACAEVVETARVNAHGFPERSTRFKIFRLYVAPDHDVTPLWARCRSWVLFRVFQL